MSGYRGATYRQREAEAKRLAEQAERVAKAEVSAHNQFEDIDWDDTELTPVNDVLGMLSHVQDWATSRAPKSGTHIVYIGGSGRGPTCDDINQAKQYLSAVQEFIEGLPCSEVKSSCEEDVELSASEEESSRKDVPPTEEDPVEMLEPIASEKQKKKKRKRTTKNAQPKTAAVNRRITRSATQK